jgi:hypothetical protein
VWYRPPDHKVTTNTMTRASFGRDKTKSKFITALIYKLQRKYHNPTNQSNRDSAKDTSKSPQLLVVWRVDDSFMLYVNVIVIKHDDIAAWDEDKLMELCSMYSALYRGDRIVKDTWLLDDTTVLMTTSEWKEGKQTIEVIISERTREDDSMEPLCIPSST